jgi:hypothetical protein
MPSFSALQQALWILAPIGQALTAVYMIRRNLFREAPWFLAYTISHVIRFAILFVAHKLSYALYFYLYWSAEGIDALLTLAVIQEIYDRAFQPFAVLRHLSSILFRWATVVLLIIMVLAAASSNGTEQDRIVAGLLVLDRSACFVQCGLLFLLFVFKDAVGATWTNLSRGIALGLAIVSGSTAITLTVRAYSYRGLDPVFNLILAITYNIAIFVWVAVALRSELIPTSDRLVDSDVLRSWDSALVKLTRR